MSEAESERDEATPAASGRQPGTPEKAQLEIHKGVDGKLDLGGLRFVACRREIKGIDGGVTFYVRGAVDGAERDLIRFDFFRRRPHFHVPAENQSETAIDVEQFGDGFEWGLDQVSTRMKALLEEAGFADLGEKIDPAVLAESKPRLRELVAQLAEPSEISYFEVDASVVAGLAGGD
jgi:hypothetical protein